MIQEDVLEALAPVAKTLEDLGVPWHIGGSVASCVWGEPRSTLAADIVAALRPEHADPVVARLQDAYYVSEAAIADAIRTRGCFNLIHLTTMLKIDVYLPTTDPLGVESFARRRTWTDESGVAHPVATAEDTVLHKLKWYRRSGHVSDRQWRDIVGVFRVQDDAIDASYLQRHATALGLDDLLSRAHGQAREA